MWSTAVFLLNSNSGDSFLEVAKISYQTLAVLTKVLRLSRHPFLHIYLSMLCMLH